LQATTYILTKGGWDALTTNSIAERAGVNIASLYQYFPNKTAIVAEVRRRHLEALHGCQTSGPPPRTLQEALERGVETVIRQRLTNPELHRVFSSELPRISGLPPLGAGKPVTWNAALTPDVPDLEMATFIAHAALTAAIDEAARERPQWLEARAFKDELVTLLSRYLLRRGTAKR
jgi:AcrR family transcriptional regulator